MKEFLNGWHHFFHKKNTTEEVELTIATWKIRCTRNGYLCSCSTFKMKRGPDQRFLTPHPTWTLQANDALNHLNHPATFPCLVSLLPKQPSDKQIFPQIYVPKETHWVRDLNQTIRLRVVFHINHWHSCLFIDCLGSFNKNQQKLQTGSSHAQV